MTDGAKTSRPSGHGTGARRLPAALLLALIAALSLLLAMPALAATVTNDRPLLFSFDGSDTTAGPFDTLRVHNAVAVDDSNGDVYVIDRGHEAVDRFDYQGAAQQFTAGPAAGTSSLYGPTPGEAFKAQNQAQFQDFFGFTPDLAVDNSGLYGGPGPGEHGEQGRLYVSGAYGPIDAFDPQGNFLWALPVAGFGGCGIAVDAEGHLWVGAHSKVVEFDNAGSLPAKINEFPVTSGVESACQLAVDSGGGSLYAVLGPNTDESSLDKYVEATPGAWTFDSTLDPNKPFAVAVDQSSAGGHVFAANPDNEHQRITVDATEGKFKLTYNGETTVDIPYNATATYHGQGPSVNRALEALPSLQGGLGELRGGPGGTNPYIVEFARRLGSTDVEQITCTSGNPPLGGGTGCAVATINNGEPGGFQEYEPGGPLIGTFGRDLIGAAAGISHSAYEPPGEGPLDRVYVSDREANGVKVFGPLTTGTVPDVTTQAADGVTHNAATAHGTINPQGVNNSYHFEWKRGTGPNWATAQSSPPQSIAPTDSADHAVSFAIGGLSSNTAYQVRLVGTNTANDLSSYSTPPVAFQTPVPPVPIITNLALSAITTSSAHLAATIDPQEETTTWKVQESTDPGCAGPFTDLSTQTISNPGPGTVAIAYDLSGLLPAQTYCVRLSAKNGNPVPATADQVIQTLAVPPTDVSTAFAAPRTDTTARLNGYVNPQGEAALTYYFEYRADGDPTWTTLDPLVSTRDARTQIVVADEISNLQPNTTYHYRFFAKNSASGWLQGGEKTFITRAAQANPSCPNADVRAAQHTAYLPQCRAVELVNQPDKGNQNPQVPQLASSKPFSASGEDLLWTVAAGAPGSPTGSGGIFLSTRAPGGWGTQSLLPGADQLEGGAQYFATTAPPDFSRFLVGSTAPTLFRFDRNRHGEAIAHFLASNAQRIDTTDDLAHVVLVDQSNLQLVDIGSGAPELLSVMPGGLANQCGLSTEGGSFVGRGPGPGPGGQWRPGDHMIAATDASRVYFQAIENGASCGGSSPYALYVRNRETGETTLIDPGVGSSSPAFTRAGADGRTAYFVTPSNLDPVDQNSDPDVYRWDEQAGESTCLTCVIPDANLATVGGQFIPVIVSDDASHIYFQSKSQLVPGRGAPGQLNLYVLSGSEVSFVADPRLDNSALGNIRASADGDVLLFESDLPLTSDPIVSSCTSLGVTHPCREVYRYDDRDGGLECLSCAPGATTTADVGYGTIDSLDDVVFDLSADGETAAFTTTQALLPADVNATADLYQWHDGVRSLITDGVTKFKGGRVTPALIGLSGSGRDLFFTVDQSGLTGFEADGLANLYDARIDGGFIPPSPPEHCSEESCQGPLQPAPSFEHPGSSSFVGPGNLPETTPKPRCGNGKVRRHRRCVRRHPHKQRRHRGPTTGANRGRAK